jgi:hypothetical protein
LTRAITYDLARYVIRNLELMVNFRFKFGNNNIPLERTPGELHFFTNRRNGAELPHARNRAIEEQRALPGDWPGLNAEGLHGFCAAGLLVDRDLLL